MRTVEIETLSGDWKDEADVAALVQKIADELNRARHKFPGKNVTFAALVEEVGELATAIFEESADRVEKEAIQVAVMAMRMVLDGDHCFDNWRREKGLDPLRSDISAGDAPAAAEEDALTCFACKVPFQADDICATDINEGTAHAACLEGSAVVDLETGEPSNGPLTTWRYGDRA